MVKFSKYFSKILEGYVLELSELCEKLTQFTI